MILLHHFCKKIFLPKLSLTGVLHPGDDVGRLFSRLSRKSNKVNGFGINSIFVHLLMISVYMNCLDLESPASDESSTEEVEASRKCCHVLQFQSTTRAKLLLWTGVCL